MSIQAAAGLERPEEESQRRRLNASGAMEASLQPLAFFPPSPCAELAAETWENT